ncbi:MAG: nucleoside 2-deoxyribosyltransferase domain-containing protein [Atribacterota bacterium]|nr:nucleoside 2-deoxyribosyltransferase domain-containing protein [Atribacterota bacterium]
MKIYKPPQKVDWDYNMKNPYIFLAGSIEMGKATEWQTKIEIALRGMDCRILNPRRDNWDSSWEQKIGNKQFKEQVEWELDCQDKADIILMYFDPATKSPITLLELGLFVNRNLIVCCPDGFWRKGNVDIVCERYDIETAKSLDIMIKKVKRAIYKYNSF